MLSGRVIFGKMDEVSFGRPAAGALVEQLDRLGAKRAFLMVSGTLNRETDEIARIRSALGARCAAVFDAMPAHTPRSAVVAATQMAREAQADVIVTIGGGSLTDGAKAVQLCLANGVETAADIDCLRIVGGIAPQLAPPALRQISIPTTISAGEFSAIAGVSNETTKTKEMLRHERVMPSAVILDPAITVHTPEWLWLSTGVRAIDHCVEGVCSRESHPYGDAQGLKGLELLASGLMRVKQDSRDLAARLDCQIGAWLSMGPLAAGIPMGASHGIGYVLGAAFGVPHGHTSCIMLPAVMQWNSIANADRQALVAAAMGKPGADAARALDALIGGLGMPRSLSAVKIGREHFDLIARQAMRTPWVPRNPRKIEGPEQVREILEIAA